MSTDERPTDTAERTWRRLYYGDHPSDQQVLLPDGTPVADILTELQEARAALAASRSLLRIIRYAAVNCKSSEAPSVVRKNRKMIDNG